MKKFKIIALSFLSLALCVPLAFTLNVKRVAAETVGVIDNKYLTERFVDAKNVSLTANEFVPEFMQTTAGAERNGVLLSFKSGGTVTLNKTFKPTELNNFMTFLPLVLEKGKILTKPSVSEFYIELKNAAGDKTVSYRFIAVGGANWASQGKSALSVAAKDGTNEQTYAGYCLNTQWTKGTSFEGKPFLRKGNNGYTVDSGFAGSGGAQKPITMGYVQEGDKVQATVSYKKAEGVFENLSADLKLTEYEYNGVKIGNVVRDLNKNIMKDEVGEDYDPSEGDNADIIVDKSEVLFNGFNIDDDITVTLRAANVDGTGYLLVTDIAGESLRQRVRVQNADKVFKATKSLPYVIPVVKAFIVNAVDGEAFGGTYSVSAPEGSALSELNKTYVTGASFTPDVAGEYNIKYSVTAGGKTYENSIDIECIESANLAFTKAPDGFVNKNVYSGVKYDIGAKAKSDIYVGIEDNTKVYAKIEYSIDKAAYTTVFEGEVAEKEMKSFDKIGFYKIYYTVRDDGGNVLVSDKVTEFKTVRNYISLTVQDGAILSYGTDTENFIVNRGAVKIYDYKYGADFFDKPESGINYYMSVSFDGGAARNLTEDEMLKGFTFPEQFGAYTFKYYVNYVDGGETITFPEQIFRVTVMDDTSPEIYLIGDDYLIGAQKTDENGKILSYRAVTGSTVTFGYLRVRDEVGEKHDLSDKISLSAIYNSEDFTLDKNYASDPENFTYTFKNPGEYIFKFSVKDSSGNADDVILKITVKNGFYTLKGAGELKKSYTTLDVLSPSDFTVVDQNGNEVTGAAKSFALTRGGDTVEAVNGKFEFEKSGDYTFMYIAAVNGETVEKAYNFTVTDKTVPVITVEGTVYKTGVKNKFVKIASFTAADNESSVNMLTNVTFNGEEINVFEGKFIPEEAGEYIVTFKAVDEYGNVSEYSYVITVREAAVKRPRIFAIIGFAVGGLLIAAAVTLIVIAKSKKGKKAENDDKE